MKAKICDKCGKMWTDSPKNPIYVRTIGIAYDIKDEANFPASLSTYPFNLIDLCNDCLEGLRNYLKPHTAVQDAAATNPVKKKKRGRPPKNNLPGEPGTYIRKNVPGADPDAEAEPWIGGIREQMP